MYKVQYIGLKELKEVYAAAPTETILGIKQALQKSGDLLVDNTVQKIKAKKLVDRGKLMQYTKTYVSGPLQQTVEIEANYASGLEEGTPPYFPKIEPLKGWARRKLGNEKLAYVVAKSISRKGIRARWYHKEAIQMSEARFNEFLEDIILNVYSKTK